MATSATITSTTPTPDESTLDLPTYQDVADASQLLTGVAHRTPIKTSRTIDQELGVRVFFKCENMQRMGAFKFRGAYTAVNHYLQKSEKGGGGGDGGDVSSGDGKQQVKLPGILTYSSGNHAQAIALASTSLLGVPSTIIMPYDAPPLKVAATESYGGNIVYYDRYKEKRDEVAKKVKETLPKGTMFIGPYDHKYVISGQGTVGIEMIEDLSHWKCNNNNSNSNNNNTNSNGNEENEENITLDYLFVCVGGGGLISGISLATHALSPTTQIIGVEPQAGNDAQQSLETGSIVHIETPRTIADGAQTQHLGELTYTIMKRYVSKIITVSDEELIQDMKFFGERMKMIVEPTGCLGLAGLRKMVKSGEVKKGSYCGVVISGGNVDLGRYCDLISSSLK